MLDGEVFRVVEDGDGLAVERRIRVGIAVSAHGAFWGDWDGVERDGLRSNAGHYGLRCGRCDLEWFAGCGEGTNVRMCFAPGKSALCG